MRDGGAHLDNVAGCRGVIGVSARCKRSARVGRDLQQALKLNWWMEMKVGLSTQQGEQGIGRMTTVERCYKVEWECNVMLRVIQRCIGMKHNTMHALIH